MAIVDADGHAVDRDAIYRERLPQRFRKRVALFPNDGFDRAQNGTIVKGPQTPQQNLADNDLEGIDLQVIYPTAALMLSRVRERELAVELARTYNDWLFDWCAVDRRRLKGVAAVPLHVDVAESIRELDRCMSRLGTLGVMVNTYDPARNVAHPDFWPFYEECARQNVPVSFHASGSDTMDAVAHFDTFLGVHTLSHAPEQLIACTAILYSGLLERFQDLRVAFLEAGCGWVPFWMEHTDEEWEKRPFDAPLLTAKPSEYMASGRVYVSCEPEEKTLRCVPDFFPAANILYASDYPHWDGAFPNSVATLADRTDLPDALKRQIFLDNPCRFYNLQPSVILSAAKDLAAVVAEPDSSAAASE
ncbi:MAG TPA: amidohydrolase family protein [Chloroflexota bacterium]|nr:amidohydrolase family protein [Chloroflexota bacterium]